MKPKIAVVEDNLDNRLLVQAILDEDYEISEYENGMEVVEGLGDDVPDLVLLDISLPGMDGTEVLEWLRAQGEELSSLPVIALTAHAMSGDREKYLEMGFDEYVTKPIVDEDVLMGAIERLLAGSA
jgi:CheY-like chemotaxis protein